MAYSYQTFTYGQVLTAAEMQQTEDNVRDHSHGSSGVSATMQNIGIGVAPSSWGSGTKAINVGSIGSLAGAATTFKSFYNAFDNGSEYVYQSNNAAVMTRMYLGQYDVWTAPTGNAGSAASFTEQFTVTHSNGLLPVLRYAKVATIANTPYVSPGLQYVSWKTAVADDFSMFTANSGQFLWSPVGASLVRLTAQFFVIPIADNMAFQAYITTPDGTIAQVTTINSTAKSYYGGGGGIPVNLCGMTTTVSDRRFGVVMTASNTFQLGSAWFSLEVIG